jgi:ubiquinone/menaquinone biosynthesis C-methylase UbiE
VEQDAARERAQFKVQQTKHWDEVAGGWAARADWTERNFAPLTAWLRTTGCWRAGSRVLDVACGSGYPAIAAALAVGPAGHVVAADISPEMLAAAASRARAMDLVNIEFVEQDSEALRFDADSFDAVTDTYALMFCPDLDRAVGEMRRVLRPNGCAAIVVWDEPKNNPYFELFFAAAGPLLGLAPPTPGTSGPFRLASSEVMAALMRAAGFSDVAVEHLPMTFECESVDDYIQMFSDFAFKSRMARLTVADRARLRAAVADLGRPYVGDRGRVRLLTTSLCAIGRRPADPSD